jgi:hypothetical protein
VFVNLPHTGRVDIPYMVCQATVGGLPSD